MCAFFGCQEGSEAQRLGALRPCCAHAGFVGAAVPNCPQSRHDLRAEQRISQVLQSQISSNRIMALQSNRDHLAVDSVDFASASWLKHLGRVGKMIDGGRVFLCFPLQLGQANLSTAARQTLLPMPSM